MSSINLDRLTTYIEDDANGGSAEGFYMLGIRQDAAGSPVSADGDFHPFVFNDDGELKVIADIAVNAEKAEDSAHISGDIGNYVLAVRSDTRPTGANTSATGDYASLFVNANGEMYVKDTDAETALNTIETTLTNIETDVDAINNTVADDAADAGNPLKIGSRAVTGALTAVSANNDRADLLSDDFRRVWINDSPNVGAEATAVSVGTLATSLPATPLTGRRRMIIQNQSAQSIWVGDTGVTTTTGLELTKRASMALEIGDDVDIQAIVASGTSDVRVFELA